MFFMKFCKPYYLCTYRVFTKLRQSVALIALIYMYEPQNRDMTEDFSEKR